MSLRTLLITNPGSRSGESDIDDAAERLEREGDLNRVHPDRPQDLPEAIRKHAGNADRIVLGGGDGTVNLALDVLLEVDKPVGLLPMGTANDLARSLDIPTDLDKAVDVIVRGNTRRIDVARVNGVSFINAIGIGLGPQMTREMDSESKSRFGVLAYLIGITRALRGYPAFTARITSDGGEHQGRYLQVTVANGIHYGGGMTIADDAKIDDGKLDVLLTREQSRLSLLGNALRFRSGLTHNADTLTHWRCTSLELESDETLDVTADGEFLTETPVDVSVIPRALTLFAPD